MKSASKQAIEALLCGDWKVGIREAKKLDEVIVQINHKLFDYL
jgi:hypothetical protein